MKQILRLTTTLIVLLFLGGSAWGQYAGAGTFTKITSIVDLTDGYYVIVNNGDAFAMNSSNAGSFFTHTAITPIAGTLTDPVAAIVWKIETNGSGRSIYNEESAKYVSYTGGSNAAQAVAAVTTDNQRWEFTYPSTEFLVKNLGVTTRLLKYNASAPRFACYTSGQQNLLLYKMEAATNEPKILVNPPTLTGFTYVLSNGPSAEQNFTVEGTNLTNDIFIAASTNYEISTETGGAFSPTNPIYLVETGGEVLSTNIYVRLKAGLSVGTYDSELITATSTGATDKTVTCSGSVTAPPVPTITLSETALTGFTYLEGGGPSSEQTFTVQGSNLTADISISAPTNYEISKTSGTGYASPITFTIAEVATPKTVYVRLKAGLSAGTYNGEEITATSSGATNKTVTCSGNVSAPPAPGYFVDFEGAGETKTSYASGTVSLSGMDWNLTEALIGTDAADWKNGIRAARMRGYGTSAMTMLTDKSNGIGTVSFNYRRYGTDTQVNWQVEYSTDAGTSWTQIGSSFTAPSSDVVQLFSEVVNVTGDIRIRIKRATETGTSNARLNVDDIMLSDIGSGTAPIISNIVQTPNTNILSTTTVSVSADVTDSDGTIEGVELHWGTASGSLTNNIAMTLVSGNTYTTETDIPAQSAGTTVYYEVYALDDDLGETTSPKQSYQVAVSEPSNHPTGFTAEANTSSKITVDWTDAVPAADGYLIKGSDVNYGAIVAPVDGAEVTNGALVQNVASGVQTFQFTGLTASTTYYFKIYPYNGSGAAINYKTDGTVAQASAKTDDAPPPPNFLIDFDDDTKWIAGSAALSGYAIDHTYADQNWLFTGGPAVRNTTTAQDGFAGALGTYSWRLRDASVEWTATYTEALQAGDFFTGFGFDARRWDGNPSPAYTVEYSFDGGNNFSTATSIGTNGVLDNAAFNNSSGWVTFLQSTTSNDGLAANQFIVRLSATGGERVMVDNFTFDISSAVSCIYTGTGNWSNSQNWDNVPGSYSNAIINGNVTLDVNVVVNDLTVSEGSSLTIAPTKKLTVNGTLTNNADASNLVIKSDAMGTGSLIHSTANVPATVEQYITGASENWHLISSPVESQAISGEWTPTGTYGDGTGYDFYAWDEPTTAWLNQKVGANNIINFIPGKGYLVAYQEINPTKIFAGELNEGSTSLALTTSGTSTYGWSNLAGNPYPSSIDWKATSGWDRNSLYENGDGYDMHIWNGTSANYGTYNSASTGDDGTNEATRYIAPMQGFMVKAKTAGNLSMNNEVRVHSSQPFLKSTQGLTDYLKLKVTGTANTYSDEAIIEFNHDSNQGGASKLFSFVADAPSLYTVKSNDYYAINFMGMPAAATAVSLNFKPGQDGAYTISAFNIETFAQGTIITLEDLKTGTTHNFNEKGNYQFQASTSDDPARFKIHFAGTFSIHNPSTIEGLNIYSNAGIIYFNSEKALGAQVEMYNVTGQKVFAKKVLMDGLTQININLTTGWYIVKVSTQEGIATQKVFIQAN